MSIIIASWIIGLMGVYLAIGFLFACYFIVKGVGKIDPNAEQGTWGFRLLIFPGVMIFWVLLLHRMLKGSGKLPEERTAHRQAANS